MPVTGEVYKQIGRNAASPVCIAAAYDRVTGAVVGLTASSFVTLSFEPPMVMFAIQQHADSYTSIVSSKAFGVSLLGRGQSQIASLFATKGREKYRAHVILGRSDAQGTIDRGLASGNRVPHVASIRERRSRDHRRARRGCAHTLGGAASVFRRQVRLFRTRVCGCPGGLCAASYGWRACRARKPGLCGDTALRAE